MYSITRQMDALKPNKSHVCTYTHTHPHPQFQCSFLISQFYSLTHSDLHTFFHLLNSTKSMDGPLKSLNARKLITRFASAIPTFLFVWFLPRFFSTIYVCMLPCFRLFFENVFFSSISSLFSHISTIQYIFFPLVEVVCVCVCEYMRFLLNWK